MESVAAHWAGEYADSEYFLFLPEILKEHSMGILEFLISELIKTCPGFPEGLSSVQLRAVIETKLIRLNIPIEVSREIPLLIREFFSFMSQSGKYPPAESWLPAVAGLEKIFKEKIRDDGSIKGETFKKKYTDVGRNDPCPCGSGAKFKKCCMALLG